MGNVGCYKIFKTTKKHLGLLPDGSDSVGDGETVVVSSTVVYTEVATVLVKPGMK